ncbi:MAG: carboxypeptidase regulatory-like domain-containing protein [Planctomycetes bacterium]|nr:carboxypeptidase regulatory-like domain-containing protein [Planctomycetota bacterium]
MKKFVLASFLATIAVLVGLLAWWTLRSEAPAAPPSATAPDGNAPSKAPTAVEAPGTARADLEPQPGPLDTARSGAVADPAAPAADSIWVEGRVEAPLGCDDAQRTVYALARESTWGDLARELDPDRPDGDAEEIESAFASLADSAEDDEKPAPRIVARTEIGADGAFRVAFPPGTKRGWLAVAGTFQYLEEARELDLAKPLPGGLVLRTLCGAAVRVRVELPAGDGVPALESDAIAVLRPGFQNPAGGGVDARLLVARTALAEAGAFAFRAMPPRGRYTFAVDPEELAALERPVEALRAGAWNDVTVTLRRGAIVRGVVLAPDRTPLAGAVVRAKLPGQWFGFDDRVVRRTTTDDAGAFELVAVPPGRVGLTAGHARFLASPKLDLDLADAATKSDVELLLEAGGTISGTVAWPGGEPARDVEVRVSFDLSQMYGMGAMNALRGGSGKARTDAEGRYLVGGLGAGPFTVIAHADAPEAAAKTEEPAPSDPTAKPSKKRADEWRARHDGVAAGTKELALVLRAPTGVRGLVTDEASAPVAKFTLYAQRTASGPLATFGQDSVKETFESADGTFVFTKLSSGTWKLSASADGFAPIEPIALELPRDEQKDDLHIVLQRAAIVRGFVRDAGGRPVGGAEVEVDTGGPNWQRFLERGPKPATARSQDDGAFELVGLRPIAQKLVASSRGFARSEPVAVDLSATRELADVVVVLRTGALLTGEVFDDAGKPARSWMVQATNTQNFDQRMEFTDSDGKFRIEHLEPGSRQVVAMPAGAGSASEDDGARASSGDAKVADDMAGFVSKMKMGTADLVDGQETHVVLGAPPKDPVRVHGRVTHAGAPYGGAMVSFMRRNGGVSGGLKSSTTDATGAYSLVLGEPGDYTVSVQKFQGSGMQQNVVEFPRTVPQGTEATLDFQLPTGRISGRVEDEDRKPVSGARVTISTDGAGEPGTLWGGQYNETATDAEGRYDVQALRPERYTVFADSMLLGGAFGDDAANGREAITGVQVGEGEWRKDVDFRLERPGTIDVTVVDEAGAPVSGASVFVRTKAGELVDRFSMLATAADGGVKYGGLAPGRYTVSAREGARAAGDGAEVEVRSGEHTPARVVLQGGTYLLVSVVDAEQKPLTASLSVKDEAGREVAGLVSLSDLMKLMSQGAAPGGERRVGPLPAGKYRVVVTLADGRTTTKPVTISGQGERKLNVRF